MPETDRKRLYRIIPLEKVSLWNYQVCFVPVRDAALPQQEAALHTHDASGSQFRDLVKS